MKIKVDNPFYNVSNGLAFSKLSSGSDSAFVAIDFKPLIASANVVTRDELDFFMISSAVYGVSSSQCESLDESDFSFRVIIILFNW